MTNQSDSAIIFMLQNKAELCNGSTTDSDSVCWGSNPYPAAKNKNSPNRVSFLFLVKWYRDSNQEGANAVCGRKQSGGLFSPTWATSEARREAQSAGKIPIPLPKNRQASACRFFYPSRKLYGINAQSAAQIFKGSPPSLYLIARRRAATHGYTIPRN